MKKIALPALHVAPLRLEIFVYLNKDLSLSLCIRDVENARSVLPLRTFSLHFPNEFGVQDVIDVASCQHLCRGKHQIVEE